jgi:archaemetzincin
MGSSGTSRGWLPVVVVACGLAAAVHIAARQQQRPRPGAVRLVPIGDAPVAIVDDLVRTYRARWQITVDRFTTLPLDARLVDPARDQVVAERVLEWLERRFPKETASGDVVIGVLARDQYIAGRSWQFAFSLRGGRTRGSRVAVVSVARMRPEFYGLPPDDRLMAQRLSKMVTKSVGALYFNRPLSDDPKSVMYRDVVSLDDLDEMNETVGVP